MNIAEKPIKFKALTGTIVIHIVLFLLFLLFRYSTPSVAPVEELGMEVNLGTSEDGNGDDQPFASQNPSMGVPQQEQSTAKEHQDDAKAIESSNEPEAPAVLPINEKPKEGKKIKKDGDKKKLISKSQPKQQVDKKSKQQQPRYVYHSGNGQGGNGSLENQHGKSQGNTKGNGDRGVPFGMPNSNNYTGSPGNGTGGISHTLMGREISPRKFEAEFSEGGKVVVQVRVDREGNILSKIVKSSPSKRLSDIAFDKISKARFSKSTDAAPEQIGTVTFIFKTRQQD